MKLREREFDAVLPRYKQKYLLPALKTNGEQANSASNVGNAPLNE
jgi:hypothetical protein